MASFFKACLLLLPLLFSSYAIAQQLQEKINDDTTIFHSDGVVDINSDSDINSEIHLDNEIKVQLAQNKIVPNKREYRTDFLGSWAVDDPNVGVAAMHIQLRPNNMVVFFDTTTLGPSARELGPPGNCPLNTDVNMPDCWAHGIEYDIETGHSRTLYVDGDPWCSSGNLLPNGDLMSTGGNKGGFRSVRLLNLADPNANFVERKNALGENRWYSSNVVLEDGSALVVGGRASFSYDIVPPQLNFQIRKFNLPFLAQTTAPPDGPRKPAIENNLYPFVFLMPNGHVFLFANDRAISFQPQTGKVVREYPVLEGGSRNYPPSGMAALLPLKLTVSNSKPIEAEVVVCGGNKPEAYSVVDDKHATQKVFLPALQDCHRIMTTKKDSTWQREQDMPSPRTMGDLLHLPTGDLLFINGATKGTAGWEDAIDPNFTPVLYRPDKTVGKRFKVLQPTNVARMYHSCSALLPDGKILVAGSNPHKYYTYNVPYPTELRIEKFSPHYLDPNLDIHRPIVAPDATDTVLNYGKDFKITFTVPSNENLGTRDIKVTMYYPPFTTHGFSMNQRLLVLGLKSVENNVITAVAPPSGKVAPPGYYLIFVTNRGVPGKGIWVHID